MLGLSGLVTFSVSGFNGSGLLGGFRVHGLVTCRNVGFRVSGLRVIGPKASRLMLGGS